MPKRPPRSTKLTDRSSEPSSSTPSESLPDAAPVAPPIVNAKSSADSSADPSGSDPIAAPPVQAETQPPPRVKKPPKRVAAQTRPAPLAPPPATGATHVEQPHNATTIAAPPLPADSTTQTSLPKPRRSKTSRRLKDNGDKSEPDGFDTVGTSSQDITAAREVSAPGDDGDSASVDAMRVDADDDREARLVRGSDMAACIVSAILHAVVLILLATLVVPMMTGHSALTLLSTSFEDGGELEIMDSLEVSALPEEETPLEDVDPSMLEPIVPEIDFPVPADDLEEPEEVVDSVATPTAGAVQGAAVEATSVESAVDGVTGDILGELAKGDLLVVWLLDASHSLVDDRQRVADRLTPFFAKIDASREANPQGNLLMNAVVSFGATTRERVPPTKFGPRIVGAVKKLPIDESGKENVFASIAQCASTYRKKWKEKSLMLVVWTDETGDDSKRLEQTISICHQHKVKVSVVGPSSVLGAETGLHSYTDEKSKRRFLLPVNRGPDSAQSERLELGYWFAPRVPGFGNRRGPALPSWYGGDDMKGVASGFSPYALTRIAAQTKGTYTIFDRAEDRGPFRIDTLKDYAPSYDSPSAYDEMIRYHPLRKAVMQSVEVMQGKGMQAPETMLFVKRDRRDPSRFERPFMTASQFASQLKIRKRSMQLAADRMSETIDEALRHLSKGGDIQRPLDALYEQEKSPRWKAWYDLTRGRLLAVSVRLEEYRLALDAFSTPGYLRDATNHLILNSQQNLRSSQEFQARAQEAEQLLMRCLKENAETPWAYLAQRELANGLGVRAQQATLRLVKTRGPTRPSGSPSLPKF